MYFVQKMAHRCFQNSQSVDAARAEVGGGRLLKIFRGAGDSRDIVARHKDLRQELVVKYEVVRVRVVVDALNNFTRVGAIARVVFRKFLSYQYILEVGQKPVEHVLVE